MLQSHGAIGIGSFEMCFLLLHLHRPEATVTKHWGHLPKCPFVYLFVLFFPTRLSDAVDWLFVSYTRQNPHGRLPLSVAIGHVQEQKTGCIEDRVSQFGHMRPPVIFLPWPFLLKNLLVLKTGFFVPTLNRRLSHRCVADLH